MVLDQSNVRACLAPHGGGQPWRSRAALTNVVLCVLRVARASTRRADRRQWYAMPEEDADKAAGSKSPMQAPPPRRESPPIARRSPAASNPHTSPRRSATPATSGGSPTAKVVGVMSSRRRKTGMEFLVKWSGRDIGEVRACVAYDRTVCACSHALPPPVALTRAVMLLPWLTELVGARVLHPCQRPRQVPRAAAPGVTRRCLPSAGLGHVHVHTCVHGTAPLRSTTEASARRRQTTRSTPSMTMMTFAFEFIPFRIVRTTRVRRIAPCACVRMVDSNAYARRDLVVYLDRAMVDHTIATRSHACIYPVSS